MKYLYDMCAKNLSWLIGGPSEKKQGSDATSSSENSRGSSSVDLLRSNNPQENIEENVELNKKAGNDVGPNVRINMELFEEPDEECKKEESRTKVTSQIENDNEEEESKNLHTETDNQDDESKDANTNSSINANVDLNTPLHASLNASLNAPISAPINITTNVHPASYAAYFPQCDDFMEQNKINFINEDGESLYSSDSDLETSPIIQSEIPNNSFEQLDYPYSNSKVDIDATVNAPINVPSDVDSASYAAYFPECDEFMEQNKINSIFSLDGESLQSYESDLETPPLTQSELPTDELPAEDLGLSQYPTLTDIEPTTDLALALKAGPMPRLCTHCFRWEDQPDDKYDEKDMVSDKCCMLGNIVFFKKIKPFWTQCSACGFGMPKKVVKGRRISRIKKVLCKVTGREYKGYEFKRFGYEWMSEEGRNKGLSHYF